MTENNTSPTTDELRARAEALALLGRAHAARAHVEQEVTEATGTRAQGRLTGIVAQLAAAEIQLATSVDSPAGSLGPAELASFQAMLDGTERAADAASQAAGAETADASVSSIIVSSAATRQEVQSISDDLFKRRIFDPYLHFDSPEEKARYETEQAERQRQIQAALAEHTPEGNLRAGGLAAGGMLEAAAHGATASPDFLPKWNKLVARLQAQEEAMGTSKPQDVAKNNAKLRKSIRNFLEQRGVPEDQIEQVMRSDHPLSAVTPYLNDHLANGLEKQLQKMSQAAEPPRTWPDNASTPAKTAEDKPSAAAAPLVPEISAGTIQAKAVNLAALDGVTSTTPDAGHGLPDSTRPMAKGPTKGGNGIG